MIMKSTGISSGPAGTQPVALIVDDDPAHNRILAAVLKKLGIASIMCQKASEFLAQLKTTKPNICLVDLNIDDLGVGFTLIKAVRKVLGAELPIIVLSGHGDRQAVAHAVEVGANDFIAKPLDKGILASKLTRYLMTEELLIAQSALFPVPQGGSPAYVTLEFELQAVDEFGIQIVSKHLLNKGSVYHIESPLLHEVTGAAEPHLFTVTSTSIDRDGENYLAFCEFDQTNEAVLTAVRRWLSKNA
jgi:ActR/RegA family two-component response regulator